jgi:hypothetical protein
VSWNYKKPPAFALDAIPTERGWEAPLKGTNPADNLRELVVAIGNLPLKAGPGDVISVTFDAEALEQGDALSVTIKFSEKVNVVAGASISITVEDATDVTSYTLHALQQEDTLSVVFDQNILLDGPVLLSTIETNEVTLIIEEQNIIGDIFDADAEGESVNLAISADVAAAAGSRIIPLP